MKVISPIYINGSAFSFTRNNFEEEIKDTISYEEIKKMLMIIKGIIIVVVVSIATLGILTYTNSIVEETQESITQTYLKASEYVHAGKISEAIEAYDQIIRYDYSEEMAWHEKGKLIKSFDDCTRAYIHYAEYLKVFPDSPRALEGFEEANNCRTLPQNNLNEN